MKKTGYVDDGNITLLAKGVELKGEIKVDGQVVSQAEFLAGLAEKSKVQ